MSACKDVKRFRKRDAEFVSSGSLSEDFPVLIDGMDWSDCISLLFERLDELRQFVIDEYMSGDGERIKDTRQNAFGIRHIETELKCSIYETLLLLKDVREVLGPLEAIEADNAISVDGAPDTRPKLRTSRLKRERLAEKK
jgi:hypothetical protein